MQHLMPRFHVALFGAPSAAFVAQETQILHAAARDALADHGAIDVEVLGFFLAHAGDRVSVVDGKVQGLESAIEIFKSAKPVFFAAVAPERIAAKTMDAARRRAAEDMKGDPDVAMHRYAESEKQAQREARGPMPTLAEFEATGKTLAAWERAVLAWSE